MRWIVLAMLVGCGGSTPALLNECDPCPVDNGTISGDTVVCSCGVGKGTQTYPRVIQGTTLCADHQAAWMKYSTVTCVVVPTKD